MPLRRNGWRILGVVDDMADSEEEINIPYRRWGAGEGHDGQIQQFHGNIEEVNEEKKKLKVMVKIFGRKTPVELFSPGRKRKLTTEQTAKAYPQCP